MRQGVVLICLILAALSGQAQAATYYLSPTGNDSLNGTTLAQAWATFSRAWNTVRAGDTLILADGTYRQRVAPGISGTASAHITIRAQNDGRAIIDGDTTGDGIGDMPSPVSLQTSYIDIEGLIIKNGGRDCNNSTQLCYTVGETLALGGTNNTVRRTSIYNAHPDINSIVVSVLGSNNLVEDCVVGGFGRKMMYVFGSGTRNIFRRCFVAWQEWDGREFSPGNWPWGDSIETYNASGNVFENCIVYGMTPGPGSGINIFSQGGQSSSNNAVLGTMAVKAGMKWNGTSMTWPCPSPYDSSAPCTNLAGWNYRSGFRLGNFGETTRNNLFQDIFAYGNGGYGMHVDLSSGNTNQLVRATMLNNGLGSGEKGLSFESSDRSLFSTWTNNYIQGVDTTGTGARLIYRYQSYFDAGNNLVVNLTGTPLWPWPMEDRIQSELGTHLSRWLSINPEMQNFSVTNTMHGIFNSLPAAINPLGTSSSDTQAPTTPAGLTAVAVSSSQINLTWSASTDNVGVAGYRVYRNGSLITTTSSTSYSNTGLSPSTTYSYTVAAYDAAGNASAQSAPASATTQPAADAVPPTVSITSPASGAVVSGTITVTAAASDNVGVVGVQFKVDGENLGGEDLSAPYSVSLDTTTLTNATHSLTAVARDAAGNSTTSAVVTIVVSGGAPGALSITGISDNRSSYSGSQVPQYSKFEVTFQVQGSVAGNYQLPYDPNPPSGISPSNNPLHKGISVDGLFTPDNWTTVYRQPAFYYQGYDDQVKTGPDGQSHEWHYPNGTSGWKVRFAPDRAGAWQYRIQAQDAGGSVQSTASSVQVVASSSKGFVRVSSRDKRYFEFDDGSLFIPQGLNMGAYLDDPALANGALYQNLSQNGLNFLRVWISNVYGSAWLEWLGGENRYDGYLPRSGLEPFRDPATNREQLTQVLMQNDPTDWYEPCRFQFWNDPEAVKTNTNYRLRIRYFSNTITGPRVAGRTQYGVVGKITNNWISNCQDPGTGTVVTSYGGNGAGWNVVEGTWNSGSNNFLPKVYVALENATGGKVYVDSISLREDLGGGQFGPEIINEPSMQYDLYYPQEASFSLDKVVDLAAQQGIYLKLVLSEKNDSMFYKLDDDGTFVIGGKPDNADGFYALGRTLNRTKWLHQAWWRYLQARWGYSTAVHSWELTNEGDPYMVRHWELTDELGKYMRCRVFGASVANGDSATCGLAHPNRHLVTTSFWHSFPGYSAQTGEGFWGSPRYPNVDYADVHAYISTSTAPDPDRLLMEGDAAYYHLWHSNEYKSWNLGLPIVRGEAGMDQAANHGVTLAGLYNDTQGTWYHNYVWSSVDSGGLYEMYWWFEPDIYNRSVYDHRPAARALKNFLSGVAVNNGSYQDAAAQASNANLRVVGQKDLVNGNAHLWVQNKNHTWRNVVNNVTIAPVSGTVQIGGFVPNRAYTVEWWNTYQTSGQVTSTQQITASSGGVLTLPVSSLTTDVAVKVINSGSADTTPPVISGVSANSVTSSGAVITWTTNEPADRQVEYGVTTAYGSSTAVGTTLATSHSVSLSGLISGTTYNYRVRSRDAAGNLQVSGNFTFTTTGTAPLLPPGSVGASVSAAPGAGWNACDLSQDGTVNVVDVQLMVNMSLGTLPCSACINGYGVCTVVTVQRVINSSLGQACVTDPVTGPATVTLTWAASSSAGVSGYNVYRATVSGGPYTKISLVPVAGTQFVDITVQAGRNYYYVVTSVTGSGGESVSSNQAQAYVP